MFGGRGGCRWALAGAQVLAEGDGMIWVRGTVLCAVLTTEDEEAGETRRMVDWADLRVD